MTESLERPISGIVIDRVANALEDLRQRIERGLISVHTLERFLDDPVIVFRTPDLEKMLVQVLAIKDGQLRVECLAHVAIGTRSKHYLAIFMQQYTATVARHSREAALRQSFLVWAIRANIACGLYDEALEMARELMYQPSQAQYALDIVRQHPDPFYVGMARDLARSLSDPKRRAKALIELARVTKDMDDVQRARMASEVDLVGRADSEDVSWIYCDMIRLLVELGLTGACEERLTKITDPHARVVAQSVMAEAMRSPELFSRALQNAKRMPARRMATLRLLTKVGAVLGLPYAVIDMLGGGNNFDKAALHAELYLHGFGNDDDLDAAEKLLQEVPQDQGDGVRTELARACLAHGNLLRAREFAQTARTFPQKVLAALAIHQYFVEGHGINSNPS